VNWNGSQMVHWRIHPTKKNTSNVRNHHKTTQTY